MSECVYLMRAFYKANAGNKSFGFCNYKIGRTFNLDRRRRTFQTACPVPLEVVGILACKDKKESKAVEAELHTCFEGQRLEGEWFDLDGQPIRKLLRLIEAWPVASIGAYLASLPQRLPAGNVVESLGLVPLRALQEERQKTKALKQEIAELEARSNEKLLEVSNKTKEAIDYCTSRYGSVISELQKQLQH